MCLSIHPCICPSLCSSSHPSIYPAIHEFIWTWTCLAIFRSSDPCVHRSFHLIVDLFLYLATHLSIYLSICLCIHRSSCPSIYRFSYQIPWYLFPVVLPKPMPARGLTALFSIVGRRLHDLGDKTDAQPKCDTDGLEETSSASKSGPNMVCFGHFDFEICFAPQRRALFRNSTSQLPKVVREWCVLCIFTWKCASRHNGVHFFETRL